MTPEEARREVITYRVRKAQTALDSADAESDARAFTHGVLHLLLETGQTVPQGKDR